jgi:hypothetical protein
MTQSTRPSCSGSCGCLADEAVPAQNDRDVVFGVLPRWAKVMDDKEFGERLRGVLSPSRAIDNPTHLKGRRGALKDTSQALSAQGRQVFVHGFRGVGKSSVALTAAKQFSPYQKPILLYCSARATFAEIIRDMVAAALDVDPLETERSTSLEGGGSAKLFGVGVDGRGSETKKYSGVPLPRSVNEAAEMLRRLPRAVDGTGKIFIIDEFDLLADVASHESFGEFVKLLADSGMPERILFCGVASNLDNIFKAHGSTFRYFHPLKLEALKPGPCLEIMGDAEKALGVEIEHNTKMRIVQICDGFPYFVHLITEKLLWQWFNETGGVGKTTPAQYEAALQDACTAAEPELRSSYEAVAQKYRADGEIILWAVAQGSQLAKNIDTIEKDFNALFDVVPERLRPKNMLNRAQLSSRLATMKNARYEHILTSNGRGWYEFTEKRMRGYARLRAAAKQIDLKADHPLG